MFNSATTINRALSSIANQTQLPDRVIVVDDGSSDNSFEVVKTISAEFPILLELITQSNAGPSAARNTGIYNSTEDLICFLDADDEWLPTKIKKQVYLYCSLLEQKKDVGIIECFMKDISEKKIIIQDNPVLNGHHFKDFLIRNVIKGTPCVMVPRKVLNEIGSFDEKLKFAEDRMLWSSIAEKYEIHTVEEVLVNRYFGTDGNITSNLSDNYQQKKEFSMLFTKKFKDKLSNKEIVRFQLLNLNEFLTTFYTAKNYEKVIMCYQDMLELSVSAIWVARFYPTLKLIMSVIHIRIKGIYNE